MVGSIESVRGSLALVEGSDSVDAVEKALAGLVTGLQAARQDGLPEFVPGTTSMGELFNDVFTRLDPMWAKGLAALTRNDITVETLQATLDASSPILQSCRALWAYRRGRQMQRRLTWLHPATAGTHASLVCCP